MTPEVGTLIRNFVAELKAQKGISVARANKLVSHLCGWRHFIGPFTENRIPDINAGVAALREARPAHGRPFRSNTQRDLIIILRQFYLWLNENEYSTVHPGMPTARSVRSFAIPSIAHTPYPPMPGKPPAIGRR